MSARRTSGVTATITDNSQNGALHVLRCTKVVQQSDVVGPGRVKTPKLNLPIEISSRHRQFEKQKTLTTTVERRR